MIMRLSEILLERILSPSLYRQCVFLNCFRVFLSLTFKFGWIPVADQQVILFIDFIIYCNYYC